MAIIFESALRRGHAPSPGGDMTNELQAARLLALAINAPDRGDPKTASELTTMAVAFMDRALAPKSVGQQQQQIQPKKEDE